MKNKAYNSSYDHYISDVENGNWEDKDSYPVNNIAKI